jgi:hypothetical protein
MKGVNMNRFERIINDYSSAIDNMRLFAENLIFETEKELLKELTIFEEYLELEKRILNISTELERYYLGIIPLSYKRIERLKYNLIKLEDIKRLHYGGYFKTT